MRPPVLNVPTEVQASTPQTTSPEANITDIVDICNENIENDQSLETILDANGSPLNADFDTEAPFIDGN